MGFQNHFNKVIKQTHKIEAVVKHITNLVPSEVFISHEQLGFFEHIADWKNLLLYTET